MIKDKNYRDKSLPDDISETYENCSFCQPQPVNVGEIYTGVRLFPDDDTARTFINCNLVNCELPPNSTAIGCNTSIISRNIRVVTDVIVIGGNEIEIAEHYDYIHGKYDHEAMSYIYHDVVIEVKH